jgi:hypothetical protein
VTASTITDALLLCAKHEEGRRLIGAVQLRASEVLAWRLPIVQVLGDWLEENGIVFDEGRPLLEQICRYYVVTFDWNDSPFGDYEIGAIFGEEGSGSQCDPAPFPRSEVIRIERCHVVDGDYAETEVWAIFALRDGRVAYVEALCDTTGWDCQSGATWTLAASLEELWPQIGDEARQRFGQPSQLQAL